MESARRATADDVADLAWLGRALRAELAPERGGAIALALAPWAEPSTEVILASIVAHDELVAVGCIDDCVVGYGAVRLRPLHHRALLAEVHELYVHVEARGVGVGEALLDHIIEWSVDRGCVGIDSLALPGARATKNFFETFAMVARAIVVHRPLSGGTES